MKIRTDFVTNSSSTSFTTAAIQSGLAGLLGIFILLGWSEDDARQRINEMAEEQYGGFGDEGDQGNDDDDEPGQGRSKGPDLDVQDLVESDLPLEDKWRIIDTEIDKYERQWQDHVKTLDMDDYDDARKEYQDYIDYLNSMKEEADYIDFERQFQQAVEESARATKQQWVDTQKDNLINTKEQIAVLEAHIQGYGGAGHDVDEAKRQLADYRQRERELTTTLAKENVTLDYTARQREPIGPCPALTERLAEIEADYQQALRDIEQDAVNRRKRQILMERQREYEQVAEAYLREARTHDRLLRGAETIVAGADLSISVLAHVTGPVGKSIKLKYDVGKNLATGIGSAYADPDNAGYHLASGVVSAGGEIIKDRIGSATNMSEKFDRLGIKLDEDMAKKVATHGVTLVVSSTTGAIEGLATGDGFFIGGLEGLGDGLVDVGVGHITGNYIEGIGDDSLKQQIATGVADYGQGQLQNFGKNEGVIYSDWHF